MDFERTPRSNIQEGAADYDSATKSRRVFVGAENGGNEERDPEGRCFLRSGYPDVDDRSGSSSENFKDLDMVFSLPNFFPGIADAEYNQHASQGLAFEGDHHGSDNVPAFEFQKEERSQHRSSAPLFSKAAPSKWNDAQKWIASPTSNKIANTAGSQLRKAGAGLMGRGNKAFAAKLLEVSEESDTKAADSGQLMKEFSMQRALDWTADHRSKMVSISENPVADSPGRPVSMRDTGTEMTPIASQETSRTGTPMRDTTPIRSATSSQPSSPGRAMRSPKPGVHVDPPETSSSRELSDKELQMRTRREIIALGTQLGKQNIATWASREESTPATAVNSVAREQPVQCIIEIRAAAWEDAEKAKYIARFKRQEMQIQAWEDHQKARIEAEARRIEVKVERMRAAAHERLMARLAAARLKAEEKRLAAEAQRSRRASRTARQVEYIRRTGRVPCLLPLWWGCCD